MYPAISAKILGCLIFSFKKNIPREEAKRGPVKPTLVAIARGRFRYDWYVNKVDIPMHIDLTIWSQKEDLILMRVGKLGAKTGKKNNRPQK